MKRRLSLDFPCSRKSSNTKISGQSRAHHPAMYDRWRHVRLRHNPTIEGANPDADLADERGGAALQLMMRLWIEQTRNNKKSKRLFWILDKLSQTTLTGMGWGFVPKLRSECRDCSWTSTSMHPVWETESSWYDYHSQDVFTNWSPAMPLVQCVTITNHIFSLRALQHSFLGTVIALLLLSFAEFTFTAAVTLERPQLWATDCGDMITLEFSLDRPCCYLHSYIIWSIIL